MLPDIAKDQIGRNRRRPLVAACVSAAFAEAWATGRMAARARSAWTAGYRGKHWNSPLHPSDMDCDGKVAMLEECVRRARQSERGEIGAKLPQHVREQARPRCSDGADLSVPMAASSFFPGLKLFAWGESHSAQRRTANSRKYGGEITVTDPFLVIGKNRTV